MTRREKAIAVRVSHTPGPWVVSRAGNVYVEPRPSMPRGPLTLIAMVAYPESRAAVNAKLIAAAPDLAESLSEVRLWLAAGGPPEFSEELGHKVEAALRKAGVIQ